MREKRVGLMTVAVLALAVIGWIGGAGADTAGTPPGKACCAQEGARCCADVADCCAGGEKGECYGEGHSCAEGKSCCAGHAETDASVCCRGEAKGDAKACGSCCKHAGHGKEAR